MVTIKNKIVKIGNSYAVRIPKALIDTGVFEENGKIYQFSLIPEKETSLILSLSDIISENLSENNKSVI
jgi:hypothetical protein